MEKQKNDLVQNIKLGDDRGVYNDNELFEFSPQSPIAKKPRNKNKSRIKFSPVRFEEKQALSHRDILSENNLTEEIEK